MRLFLVIFLTAAIGALSYFLIFYGIRDAFHQHIAESFPHVQGTVMSTSVTTTRGRKGGVTYHLHIDYRYTVDDQRYTGYYYRYDGHPHDYSAYGIANSHPAGSAVDVYYNPADPTDSLLSPGADGQDMFTSFIILAGISFLWLLPVKSAQQPGLPWTGPAETGGFKVITEMLVTRLRMPRYPPLVITLITTAILMLFAGIVIVTGLLPTPPWASGECALVIVLISGAAVYAWQYTGVQSGKRDLVIDAGAQTVQLPLTYGRREQSPVPISQIRTVLLNKVRHRTKNGVYYTYAVILEMADGSQEKLTDLNMTKSDSLATWLKEKLGLPERLTEPAED
jgi:uncharacterized protein DUF3592